MSHGQRTSTGHEASSAEWLDLHFEANRPEYEAALRSTGMRSGWHVLDAACGAGNYLPWIADIVGPTGHITALDLAPENLDTVGQRLQRAWQIDTPVDIAEGSVLNLPYPDQTFDGVWFANTSQYLPDDELNRALDEFRRVLKRGGVLAVKDMDVGMWAIHPGPANAFWAYFEYLLHAEDWRQIKGLASRGWTMHRWLERAGFVDTWQRSMPIEWRAPLSDAQRSCLTEMLGGFSEQILNLSATDEIHLPDDAQRFWEIAGDTAHPDNPLNSPECYSRDGQFVAVGRVPAE